ncbi:glycosyltransferase [Dermatobacter hominis]|uniref:glycosyltransferase n=1 Tax=Dermatobacter hominis TaxID=2884263 RepID=UPI001D108163|nr:glycosyltransferase [Dermatobacter hominis]UDY35572.1 glycosyltransferase [Dermatobacter hominis]
MGGVAVDLRALQAHEHAVRGIGRYTLQLIREIERIDPTALRWLVADPMLPMHEEMLRLLPTGKVRRSDDIELDADPPSVFHVTSPFVEAVSEVTLLPPWVGPRTGVVATAYDLIPARFPDVYLRDPVAALRYRQRLGFLRSCDRVLSISEATSRDLVELGHVPADRVVTVYGGVGDHFTPGPHDRAELVRHLAPFLPERTTAAGYLLCPSGVEWRKNLDRLLQAWSQVAPELRHRFPLVVQCHVDPSAREALEARAAELGIADDVALTGAVSETVLIDLFRAARAVVFPSLYEGLGLPVLEARRCGTVAVVGDNSSLRELVEDPRARFDATDVDAIARVVTRVLDDDAFRDELAAQPIPSRFDWPEVAGRVLEQYAELQRRPALAVRSPRPRLAVASPVPPQLSGPSAYMAHLLEHLPRHCDLTLLTSIDPALAEVPDGVRVERLADLPLIERIEGRFDEVVYFLGNSQHHIFEERMLARRPGAVFLHDARLTILYSEMARRHPDLLPEGFGAALHRMYPGRYPAPMGGSGYLPLPEELLFGVLMVADVARVATRMFVHSEHAADLVELDCARRPEVLFSIPSPVLDDLVAARAARRDAHPTVSSFGFVSPAKRSEVLLAAMADVPGADLALVGHSGEEFLDALRVNSRDLGIGDRVTVTGKVSEDEYREWLSRSTVAVQLRLSTNGESSASVAETLAAGIPTVVTDIGTFSEYPDDVVVKAPVDLDPRGLAALLGDLLADADRLAALSAAGRAYAVGNTYDAAAKRLVEALVGPAERRRV